eukprot:9504098-Pyramimonas_sp.AAC.3
MSWAPWIVLALLEGMRLLPWAILALSGAVLGLSWAIWEFLLALLVPFGRLSGVLVRKGVDG